MGSHLALKIQQRKGCALRARLELVNALLGNLPADPGGLDVSKQPCHSPQFFKVNLAVSPNLLQRLNERVSGPFKTRFAIRVQPFREVINFLNGQFAIFPKTVAKLEEFCL